MCTTWLNTVLYIKVYIFLIDLLNKKILYFYFVKFVITNKYLYKREALKCLLSSVNV